jgi:hypothetical protein
MLLAKRIALALPRRMLLAKRIALDLDPLPLPPIQFAWDDKTFLKRYTIPTGEHNQ